MRQLEDLSPPRERPEPLERETPARPAAVEPAGGPSRVRSRGNRHSTGCAARRWCGRPDEPPVGRHEPGLRRRLGPVAGLFTSGGLGVTVFLVLGGFLVTTALLEEHGPDGPHRHRRVLASAAVADRRRRSRCRLLAVRLVGRRLRRLVTAGDVGLDGGGADVHVQLAARRSGRRSAGPSSATSGTSSVEQQFYVVWVIVVAVARPAPAGCSARSSPSAAVAVVVVAGDRVARRGVVAGVAADGHPHRRRCSSARCSPSSRGRAAPAAPPHGRRRRRGDGRAGRRRTGRDESPSSARSASLFLLATALTIGGGAAAPDALGRVLGSTLPRSSSVGLLRGPTSGTCRSSTPSPAWGSLAARRPARRGGGRAGGRRPPPRDGSSSVRPPGGRAAASPPRSDRGPLLPRRRAGRVGRRGAVPHGAVGLRHPAAAHGVGRRGSSPTSTTSRPAPCMDGDLDVPTGSLAIEAFQRRRARLHVLPAAARASCACPCSPSPTRFDGRLTALSMLSAWVLSSSSPPLLLWRVRCLLRPGAPLGRAGAFASARSSRSSAAAPCVIFLAALPWVYHEAYMWSTAMAIGTICAPHRRARTPDGRAGGRSPAALALGADPQPDDGGLGVLPPLVAAGPAPAVAAAVTRHTAAGRRRSLAAGLVPARHRGRRQLGQVPPPVHVPARGAGVDRASTSTAGGARPPTAAASPGRSSSRSSLVNYFRPDGIRFAPMFPFITLPPEPARSVGGALPRPALPDRQRAGVHAAARPCSPSWGLVDHVPPAGADAGRACCGSRCSAPWPSPAASCSTATSPTATRPSSCPGSWSSAAVGLVAAGRWTPRWSPRRRAVADRRFRALALFSVLANTAIGVSAAREMAEAGRCNG